MLSTHLASSYSISHSIRCKLRFAHIISQTVIQTQNLQWNNQAPYHSAAFSVTETADTVATDIIYRKMYYSTQLLLFLLLVNYFLPR